MTEVTLLINGQVLKAKKDLLMEHSDYFRAMFSGNYVENNQEVIKIDLVDAESVKAIIKYMETGSIDLTEFSLTAVGDLALSADFLQVIELVKHVAITLQVLLSFSNWVKIMVIAEMASFTNLEKYAASFGLLSFPHLKPKHIPSLHKLFWYLSHPYLNTDSELVVFEFGFNWIKEMKQSPDTILIILGCLDIKSLKRDDLELMAVMVKEYHESLSAQIIDCLIQILIRGIQMLPVDIIDKKDLLCELFSYQVYDEVLNAVQGSRPREVSPTPIVSLSLTDTKAGYQFLYQFNEQAGFEKLVEVAKRVVWGWSVTSWGRNKLVLVGGEFGRGSGLFMRDVSIWDALQQQWTMHEVQLPPRRHAGVAVIGNDLYIIGGVGTYRVVLSSSVAYNLEERYFRNIQDFPDVIQNPPICVHKGDLYVGGQKNVYKYHNEGERYWWRKVLDTDIRANYMVSLGDYIYMTQNYFSHLFRFNPDCDGQELVTFNSFSNSVAAMCNVGKSIIAFTQTMCGQKRLLTVEEYRDGEIKTLWSEKPNAFQINDVAGCCSVVLTIRPLNPVVSPFGKHHLSRFPDTDVFSSDEPQQQNSE